MAVMIAVQLVSSRQANITLRHFIQSLLYRDSFLFCASLLRHRTRSRVSVSDTKTCRMRARSSWGTPGRYMFASEWGSGAVLDASALYTQHYDESPGEQNV